MSDDRRLRDKLTKLAAEEEGDGARRIVTSPGRDMTRAILEEIDETILGRTLVFRAPEGAALHLAVANRRLLAVTAASDTIALAREESRHVVSLGADDEASLSAAAEAIARFAGAVAQLTVTSETLDRSLAAAAHGRSAAAIAATLGIDLYDRPAPVPTPDPGKGFDSGLARLALAVAVVSSADPSPATGPDVDAVGRLSAISRDDLARLLAELGPEEARAGRFLLLHGEEGVLFLGQKDASRAIMALLPHDHAGAVAALWTATREKA